MAPAVDFEPSEEASFCALLNRRWLQSEVWGDLIYVSLKGAVWGFWSCRTPGMVPHASSCQLGRRTASCCSASCSHQCSCAAPSACYFKDTTPVC